MTQYHVEPTVNRRRGEAFWRRTLAAQRSSNLTQLQFCRRNDLPLSTFQRWRKRLQDGSAGREGPSVPAFVSVEVCPDPESTDLLDRFELVFPNGLRLHLPSRVEGRALTEVLLALEVAAAC